MSWPLLGIICKWVPFGSIWSTEGFLHLYIITAIITINATLPNTTPTISPTLTGWAVAVSGAGVTAVSP